MWQGLKIEASFFSLLFFKTGPEGFTLNLVLCKDYISSYRKSRQKWLRELYNTYKNFIMTNEDNNHDTKYTIHNDTNNHDARDLHK